MTVAGSSRALPGTAAATVKVTPYQEYPAKGRATGGVRCHRFLKGEAPWGSAWAGPGPARAATDAGVPSTCLTRTAAGTAPGNVSARDWPPWAGSPRRPARPAGRAAGPAVGRNTELPPARDLQATRPRVEDLAAEASGTGQGGQSGVVPG